MKRSKHMSFYTCVNGKKAFTLLDNGSEGDLLDYPYARKLNLPNFKLAKPVPLHLGNGEFYKEVTEAALIDLDIGDHREQLVCYLTDIPRCQLVLGDTWFKLHNPAIHWIDRTVTFTRNMF